MDIGFVTSPELVTLSSSIPKIANRATLVSELINSYHLLDNVEIIEPIRICGLQLAEFHTKRYVEALEKYNPARADSARLKEHGLEYDCPAFNKMYSTMCAIGGASLAAAEDLGNEVYRVTINWFGGWHHGQPDRADGFCYINDCALAIRQLRQVFNRVLYIDLDLHHGNGVETAFYFSPNVLTYSVHKFSPGFYPGSGELKSIGEGKGEGYTVNIPLKDGASDATLQTVVDGTLDKVVKAFSPDAIVCQCGVDGVSGDPHQAFTYTPEGMSRVVQKIVGYDKPTLLLGGGGYNHPNTARTWTKITADLLKVNLSDDIPDHKYFSRYGPGFEIGVKAANKRDENTEQYIKHLIDTVNKNLEVVK